MAESSTALVVRPTQPLVRRPRPEGSARLVELRRHLDDSRERLRNAIERVRVSARELTPAAQISHQPLRWVVGGLLLGAMIGFFTASRR